MPHAIDVLTPPVLYATKSVRVSYFSDIKRETTRYFGINDPESEDGHHGDSNNKKCCLM
ncbi:MAG: hypothetical protein AB7V32_00145 [Candidatus Berkiella sp.]